MIYKILLHNKNNNLQYTVHDDKTFKNKNVVYVGEMK
jgi:hypothetical protein